MWKVEREKGVPGVLGQAGTGASLVQITTKTSLEPIWYSGSEPEPYRLPWFTAFSPIAFGAVLSLLEEERKC